MDKAEELLNTLDVNDENLYPVSPYEEAHIVIGKDRVITVPPDLRRLGVQYDKNVESVTFDCPRYWDGIDLLDMAMYINYVRSDGKTGSYHVADTAVDPDDENMINFTWTISEHVAYVNGKITFLVCAKHSDSSGASTNRWNSEINRDCYISEGMDTNQVIDDVNTDLITQVLLKIDELDEKCTTIPIRVSQLENDSKYLSADGSVSFGRKTGTTVGEKSIAFGYDVEASGLDVDLMQKVVQERLHQVNMLTERVTVLRQVVKLLIARGIIRMRQVITPMHQDTIQKLLRTCQMLKITPRKPMGNALMQRDLSV